MSTEQTFVDLVKEGKISDAIETIKSALTEMSGETVVETKFEIAEKHGMKKKEVYEEGDDDIIDDDDEKDKKSDDDEDDE
ncbi:MAG: hypothetical protein R3230_00755 [Nitrosopumilaceae archaeon]|nr:hypothetical protein [Nitrosopumilaceae archaeon]